MTNEEYLQIFGNVENDNLTKNQGLYQEQSLSNTQNQWDGFNENLNSNKNQMLRETKDLSQYNQFGNVNASVNIDFQFETKINGNSTDDYYDDYESIQPSREKKKSQFVERNLNEVKQIEKPFVPDKALNETMETLSRKDES